MDDTQYTADKIMPAYQRLLWRKEQELETLRELQHIVNLFLNRQASFAQLREAAKESEVQS